MIVCSPLGEHLSFMHLLNILDSFILSFHFEHRSFQYKSSNDCGKLCVFIIYIVQTF